MSLRVRPLEQSESDEGGWNESQPCVGIHLPGDMGVLKPAPMLLDHPLHPVPREEGNEGKDEAAQELSGDEGEGNQQGGSQKLKGERKAVAGIELETDIRSVAGDQNRKPCEKPGLGAGVQGVLSSPNPGC